MKKLWKALGLTALAAALPIRVKKDEATGKKTFQTLLLSVDVGADEGEGIAIDVSGGGLLPQAVSGLVTAKRESDLFTDDPEEAVLFADDQPEAAVVDAPPAVPSPAAAESAVEAEDPAEPEATEEDFDPEL